jgi:hypothetical protein
MSLGSLTSPKSFFRSVSSSTFDLESFGNTMSWSPESQTMWPDDFRACKKKRRKTRQVNIQNQESVSS